MIRILHVVHTMECGGIETMLMNIYRKIDRNTIQFDFLVNGTKESYYTEEIISLGGKVLNVTPKRISLIQNLKDTLRVMREGNYEIVHIHQDSMIAFACWCAKKSNIKHIFTHAHTTSANGWYRKLIAQIGRMYISKTASVKFACSHAAASWIYGKKEKDYILFKNAIDAGKFQYNYEKYHSNRNECNFTHNQFVIGTCGRLSVEKNQIFLVEIFAEIKKIKADAKLILIGDGDERDRIRNRALELDVLEDVIITGMVCDVSYYYNMLDCFVLPSFFEGLPLAGIEAQAAGIPTFLSTGITNETKIVDAVYFMDLEKGAKFWADQIISKGNEKMNTLAQIGRAGYDIGENVRFLQEIYIKNSVKDKQ